MTATSEHCPSDVLKWIVWYPDQGLSDRQRGAVEAHAAACAGCRDEIAMMQGTGEPVVEAPDAERVLAQLMQRIEAHGDESGVEAPDEVPALAPRAARGRQVPLALAAAIALVAALAAGVVTSALLGDRRPQTLNTATGAAAVAPLTGPELDVVFAGDVSVERLTKALRSIRGEIVAGPTPVGRFRVQLRDGADATAAARQLRGEGADVALFAEPAAP